MRDLFRMDFLLSLFLPTFALCDAGMEGGKKSLIVGL